jgi:segregation and condensation protein A
MSYELNIQNYSGPLEKLLELIEERKLAITEISLAVVTDDFLRYLETLKSEIKDGPKDKKQLEEELRMLADFIVVAARLMLIKSKSLLPELPLTEEEQSDIKDLETRLSLYQRLKSALKVVDEAWKSENFSVSRPYFMQLGVPGQGGIPPVFHPGGNVTTEAVFAALTRVYEGLQKFVLETETIHDTILSLEEKMKDIISRMTSVTETTLQRMAGASKGDLVVTFLAMLHLAREQLVFLEQSDHFSDIIVRKIAGKAEVGSETE